MYTYVNNPLWPPLKSARRSPFKTPKVQCMKFGNFTLITDIMLHPVPFDSI